MDYLYENLGDERFQELCHAIINSEFPDSQAFPVGQPDGGRDSVVYLSENKKKEFFVYQVKYVKNPNKDEPHKWLAKILEDEAPKIDKLIPKGAVKFYLCTNVKGTGHADAGSIDKINKILEDNINVPSICWWRDDVSRKLDSNNDVKWSYSEILNGRDLLNKFVFEHLTEDRDRRENVIKAYLKDQYDIDNEVKFKQIELRNKLLDLFTDMPVAIKKINEKDKYLKSVLKNAGMLYTGERDYSYYNDVRERFSKGAADFILNAKVQNGIKRLLLEGGPGQGKSTISQYVCQVHRIRLLNKESDLKLIPKKKAESPIRLPIKIDLRDVAAWVEKKNSYQHVISEEKFKERWQNTLEAFLVAHIVYHSGLEDFKTNDLIAIFKLSPILFVFDGFDEIAGIKSRESVILFINKGLSRLSENSKSIQVVVTSRPAAFTSSIGFSVDLYPHFELIDITPDVIEEYVERWIKARSLNDRKASEIKDLVANKLKVPHLKDLAKSPMQLAILISLLNTRGESLPNKRTSLYDNYIELFFNRESEKSETIRNNRDLIIDIHQYLAWVLHSEAELFKNSGRIELKNLNDKLNEYLSKEGHQEIIAEDLFNAMKERVCALVSRVQGTFEFEVQPLREYFAAKFLYNTAPYSPVGKMLPGTTPDRFDAISKNDYWQNVTRFFAGCFSKGELPMLIEKLTELQEDDHLRYTNYPRLLTSQLLSDYVFTQYPRLLKNVMKIIIDGINLGKILKQNSGYSRNEEPILLPKECGRREVIDECFKRLKEFPKQDYAEELIGVINNNPLDVVLYWKNNYKSFKGDQLTKWLSYAYKLGIIYRLDKSVMDEIFSEGDANQRFDRLQLFISGNRGELLLEDSKLKKIIYEGILNRQLFYGPRNRKNVSLTVLSLMLHSHFITIPFRKSTHAENIIDEINFLLFDQEVSNEEEKSKVSILDLENKDEIDERIFSFFKKTKEILAQPTENWQKSLDNWDQYVEIGREHFGDNLGFNRIALIAANIKSKSEVYDEYSNLSDSNLSLCKRIRCARMKSGNINYWREKLKELDNLEFILQVFLTWATPRTIINFKETLNDILGTYDKIKFSSLDSSLKYLGGVSQLTLVQVKYLEKQLVENGMDEIKYLLRHRVPYDQRNKFVFDNIKTLSGNLDSISELKLEFLINSFLTKSSDKKLLLAIKAEYSKTKNFTMDQFKYRRHMMGVQNVKLPIENAKLIMKDCNDYPKYLASIAENVCLIKAMKEKNMVGVIAQKEKWFD